MTTTTVSRRAFVGGMGALVIGFKLTDTVNGVAGAQEMPPIPTFEGAVQLELTPELDGWLRIAEDGGVTLFTGRVEIGNGVLTALNQIVAEELDVAFDQVAVVSGDTDLVPNQGTTSATTTIGVAGDVIRKVSASARQVLLELAATELDAEIGAFQIQDGVISVSDEPGRAVSYGELIGGGRFERTVNPGAPLKSPADYQIVGQSIPRIDLPGKLTGADGDFVENARVPGMRFARLLRAPSYGAKLTAYDEGVAEMPGIIAVLPFEYPGDERLDRVETLWSMPGDFIAVVAEREHQAIRAVERLRESAEWDEGEELPVALDGLYDWILENGQAIGLQEDYATRDRAFEERLEHAAQTLSATYRGPYLCYAPISPAFALAEAGEEAASVWSASQSPFGSRWMIAQALGFPTNEQVRVVGGSSSGLYGRRDAWDQEVDVETAVIAQAVGEPVRLQWSRADEFIWGQNRPPQVIELTAGLTADGRVDGLRADVYTAVRGAEPSPFLTAMGIDATPYQLGPMPVEGYDAGPVLRTGYMRNVFTGYNIFALESFMDELAALAGEDPVAFRLKHLEDERAIAVIEAATEQAGWTNHVGASGRGMGLSFALYSRNEMPNASYLAYVAEVEVDRGTGAVQVTKMTCAIDPGLVVNPDGVRSQVEGGAIQGMSWTMKEQVTFDRKIVTSSDWSSYPILTFPEVPEIDVVIIDRPDDPSEGIGEPVTVPVAAAIANAIYDATGAWVRQLPFTPERVAAALAEG